MPASASWLTAALGDDAVANHFVAVSTNAHEVADFGIDTANMFGFWDWVGGRYSVDSAIGLSLAFSIGPAGFGRSSTASRRSTATSSSPARSQRTRVMAMLGIWYANVLGAQTKAVLPYAHELRRFPAYLQQLDMESNGKSVRLDGSAVTTTTRARSCGVSPAPTASTRSTNCCIRARGWCRSTSSASPSPNHALVEQHDLLMANLFAQGEALAFGKTLDEVRRGHPEHQQAAQLFPGNRPSTTISPSA